MKTFDYVRSTDIASAVESLGSDPHTVVLAGGTNLVDLMKLGVTRPDRVVDINRLDFGGVTPTDDGGLRIGANVRNSDLAAHPLVRERYPVLARALLAAASGQLRNMASTGGNLLQRTRCTYFMDVTKPCNKRDPGSGCPAIEGLSRELAVLGGSSSCIATHPGDLAVALTALDAVVHYETVDGTTALPVEQLYRLPGDAPERDTTLPDGALITAVTLPAPIDGARSTYRKARDRRSYAFGLGTVAGVLAVDDGVVRDVRLALGGVSARPWRARIAEEALRGKEITAESFRSAAAAELAAATPTEQNAFKIPLLTRLIVGVLLELSGQQTSAPDDDPTEAAA